MLHVNRATVLGYAGGDARKRTMQTLVPGSSEDTVSFSIATTRRWKGKDGQPHEATEWHRVAVYGGSVEPASQMVRKGALVLVEGRLQTREFKDREGKERTVTEIVVAGPQGMVNVLSPKPGAVPPDDAGASGAEDGDEAA